MNQHLSVCMCARSMCARSNHVSILFLLFCTSPWVKRFNSFLCVCGRAREKDPCYLSLSVLITAVNWAVKLTSALITHPLTALWAALQQAAAALTLHIQRVCVCVSWCALRLHVCERSTVSRQLILELWLLWGKVMRNIFVSINEKGKNRTETNKYVIYL